jgi:hypothetical protein
VPDELKQLRADTPAPARKCFSSTGDGVPDAFRGIVAAEYDLL